MLKTQVHRNGFNVGGESSNTTGYHLLWKDLFIRFAKCEHYLRKGKRTRLTGNQIPQPSRKENGYFQRDNRDSSKITL